MAVIEASEQSAKYLTLDFFSLDTLELPIAPSLRAISSLKLLDAFSALSLNFIKLFRPSSRRSLFCRITSIERTLERNYCIEYFPGGAPLQL